MKVDQKGDKIMKFESNKIDSNKLNNDKLDKDKFDKNKFDKSDKLDAQIQAAMKTTLVPSPQLNQTLKAALYAKEAAMENEPAIYALSLWYLPMIFNFVLFSLLAAAARLMIQNIYLSYFAVGVCLYIGLAGGLLTFLWVKRANLKETATIHVEKRGAWI